MFPRWKFAVTGALLFVAFGMMPDRVYAPPAPCDNQCRMRFEATFCGTGNQCGKWVKLTCTFCVASTMGLCTTTDTAKGSCQTLTDDNTIFYYDKCNPLCSCTSAVWGEGMITSTQSTGSLDVQSYATCQ
jgi:hypothetical protein